MTDIIVHHLSSPPYTPAFNVEALAHALVCNGGVCVRQSETSKKAGKKTTTFYTMLNAGVKGGMMHMDADRRACCA